MALVTGNVGSWTRELEAMPNQEEGGGKQFAKHKRGGVQFTKHNKGFGGNLHNIKAGGGWQGVKKQQQKNIKLHVFKANMARRGGTLSTRSEERR